MPQESDSDQPELIIPPAVRQRIIEQFGHDFATTLLWLMEWVVAQDTDSLDPWESHKNTWVYPFSHSRNGGDHIQWAFEVEFVDERDNKFIARRVFRIEDTDQI